MRREYRGDPGWSNDWWGRDPIEEIEPEEEEEMEETTIVTKEGSHTLWHNVAAVTFEIHEDCMWMINNGYKQELITCLQKIVDDLERQHEQSCA